MVILRGTQIPIKLKVTTQQGIALTPTEINDLEITFGKKLRKTYSDGQITYEPASQKWITKLTQSETYSFEPDAYKLQLRMKSNNSDQWIIGQEFDCMFINDSNTEEVL